MLITNKAHNTQWTFQICAKCNTIIFINLKTIPVLFATSKQWCKHFFFKEAKDPWGRKWGPEPV